MAFHINYKKYLLSKTSILLFVCLIIVALESNQNFVENVYYQKIYPIISGILRGFTSWFSFSIGDVFYIVIFIYLIYKLIVFCKKLFSTNTKKQFLWVSFKKLFNFVLIFFIAFKLLWGLNYRRLGVAHQFNLTTTTYTKDELKQFYLDVIFDANFCRKQIADTNLPTISIAEIAKESKSCYKSIAYHFPFLKSHTTQVKSSLFSSFGSYLGFSGYYNPFSGEALLRNDLPSITLPAIATHEMAHQLGYASEDEANFIGYLAANESNNILFRYSLDLDLMDYLEIDYYRNYVFKDSSINIVNNILAVNSCIDVQVKKDRWNIRDFFRKNKKPMSSYSNFVYDKFLKINYQASGITSYNDVIGWLINYKKQFKKINK